MTTSARYAVYWIPERTHPLWQAGCRWLGRDPEDRSRSLAPAPHTATPRRYGFHATLKAPTRLADGTTEAEFIAAVRSLAQTTRPFEMPRLEVRRLADFIALRPAGPSEAVHALADRCVIELDRFRAAFTDEEWTQRVVGLDAEQLALTSRLGYHHVLHHWRFHMTLSDGFGDFAGTSDEKARLLADARAHFAGALNVALGSGELGIFVEPGAGEAFVLRERIAFGS